MKILVTGASGLLGRRVLRVAEGLGAARGTCGVNSAAGLLPLDLTCADSIGRVLDQEAFTHVVNCAGRRSPEYCRANPADAYAVNALGVEGLAREADRRGFLLLQISTDYVFPGDQAPYGESAAPRPVNLYGRSKLAGEYAARAAKRHLVARIPALYSRDLNEAANAAAALTKPIRSGQPQVLDAHTVRYYTLVDEVAAAVGFLLGRGVEGIIHLSAQERTTKAEFARRIARHLRADPDLIQDGPQPAGEDARPYDSHLDPGLYRSLGGPQFSGIVF